MLNEKKKHIIYVDKDEKPSRFLVDLNTLDEEEEELSRYEKFTEKISEFKDKVVSHEKPGFVKEKIASSDLVSSINNNQTLNNIKKLAFISIFLYLANYIFKLFKILYKIAYRVSWIGIFIVRFIALSLTAIIKPILKIKKREKFSKINKQIKYSKAESSFTEVTEDKEEEEPPFAKATEGKVEDEQIDDAYIKAADEYDQILSSLEPSYAKALEGEDKEDPSYAKASDGREEIINKARFSFKFIPDFRKFFAKPAIAFTLILFILILPLKGFSFYYELDSLKGDVLGVSETAVSDIFSAGESAKSKNFDSASEKFTSAGNNFLKAQNEIKNISGLLSVIGAVIPNDTLQLASDAEMILEAGKISAEMANALLSPISLLSEEGEKNIKDIINSFYNNGIIAQEKAHRLAEIAEKINPDILPEEYRDKFIDFKDKSQMLISSLDEFVDILGKAKIFLGLNYDKRYLLVFQNNTELRGSGGFIGSFALVDFSDGKIKNIVAPGGGSYDTEAGLKERVIAPEPLHLVNPLWHFWDANWWPDWKLSAEKLMWFYERSDGPTVDGVISFTPTVVERMLEVMGDLDMTEKYGVVINSENFWEVTQGFAEQKHGTTNTPKKIIGDLINKIMEEFPARITKESFTKLLKVGESLLEEKHILFNFVDDDLQSKVEEYGWGGRIKNTKRDYLSVVNTNIAGGKSDKEIRETIKHKAEVGVDGTIINTVEIKREHTAIKRAEFTGVRNVNWMRVYVPAGSELIEASGFETPAKIYFDDPEDNWDEDPDLARHENTALTHPDSQTKIYKEFGKTVFANWSMVDPGETTTIYLKYKLPFKLEIIQEESLFNKIESIMNPTQKNIISYSLFAQKQPGSLGSILESSLVLPEKYNIIWEYGDNIESTSDGYAVHHSLETDEYWAVLMEVSN